MSEASTALREGERLLRAFDAPVELATLLCARVRLAAADGDPDAARAALTEAEELTSRTSVGPESALGRALASARELLGTSPGRWPETTDG